MADLSLLGLAAALIAGTVSFVSPCVLPLVPGYVACIRAPAPGEVAVGNETIPEDDFCSALFGQTSVQPGVAPVAFFFDYNCPNCEVLSEDLIAMETEARGGLHLRHHEWPILGASSETSARAAIAAGRQGAQRAFNRRLQCAKRGISSRPCAVRRHRPRPAVCGHGQRRHDARAPDKRRPRPTLRQAQDPVPQGRRTHGRRQMAKGRTLLDAFSPDECQNHLRHAGYASM